MFLDSEPEVIYPAIESNAFGLPLMARKRTATLLYSTEEVLTVLEFFAVGDLSTAVLLRAVKGGVNLPQTNISAIFKVHLSLFLIAQFFITQLTLPIELLQEAFQSDIFSSKNLSAVLVDIKA